MKTNLTDDQLGCFAVGYISGKAFHNENQLDELERKVNILFGENSEEPEYDSVLEELCRLGLISKTTKRKIEKITKNTSLPSIEHSYVIGFACGIVATIINTRQRNYKIVTIKKAVEMQLKCPHDLIDLLEKAKIFTGNNEDCTCAEFIHWSVQEVEEAVRFEESCKCLF